MILSVARKTKEHGIYRRAGLVIEKWLEAHPGSDRKAIAAAAKVTPAAVGHWINGKSWPREIEYRDALRGLGINVLAIDRAVCAALRLQTFNEEEQRLLDVYRDGGPELRAKIDKLIEAAQTKRKAG